MRVNNVFTQDQLGTVPQCMVRTRADEIRNAQDAPTTPAPGVLDELDTRAAARSERGFGANGGTRAAWRRSTFRRAPDSLDRYHGDRRTNPLSDRGGGAAHGGRKRPRAGPTDGLGNVPRA